MALLGRETHHATAVRHGAYWFAACSCGWDGPMRRTLDLARLDFKGHAMRVRLAHDAKRRTS